MRRLWLEVLAIGLVDAARGHETDWIGSRDFRFICEQADLVPEAVAARFHERKAELRDWVSRPMPNATARLLKRRMA